MRDGLISFKEIRDSRGALVSLEAGKNIPFEIKRVYYLYDLNKEPRGFHAHKELQQVLVCVAGSCRVMLDNGHSKQDFYLSKPSEGLLVDRMIWREMSDFSEGCVLMVLASDYYDERDYLRSYEAFCNLVTDRPARMNG